MPLDKDALEIAAMHWHSILMGRDAMAWEHCGEAWRQDCRKQAAACIEAYQTALTPSEQEFEPSEQFVRHFNADGSVK